MHIQGRILSFFMSVVLVAGLCPGLAFAGELTGGQVTEPTYVDLSDEILQRGGLNREAPSSSTRLTAASATEAAGFEAALRAAVESWNGADASVSVDVSAFGVTADEVNLLCRRFFNENPQYFYLTGRYGWVIKTSGEVLGVTLVIDPSYSAADVEVFAATAKTALAGIERGWSDEQKALYLHDWLVTHCEYDLTYSKHSAYDALVGGSAVCQGYALAYDYLMKRAGLKDTVVSSSALNHAWNLATIDGETYFVDCTWDDPPNIGFEAYCKHDYFLRSKATFGHVGDDGSVSDWVDASGAGVFDDVSVGASTARDAAFWNDVTTAIPHVGDSWAYVKSTGGGEETVSVNVYDYSQGAERELASGLPGKWPAWGSDWGYYTSHYTCLVTNGEVFMASSPTALYRIGADGSVEVAYSLSDDEAQIGYIYGLTYDASEGQCRYQLGQSLLAGVSGTGSYALAAAVVAPAPDPDPDPAVDPDPEPGSDPDPDPDPAPDPNPEPGSDPDPEPDSAVDPEPKPGSDPDPAVDPDPEPASDPGSDTEPAPEPTVEPGKDVDPTVPEDVDPSAPEEDDDQADAAKPAGPAGSEGSTGSSDSSDSTDSKQPSNTDKVTGGTTSSGAGGSDENEVSPAPAIDLSGAKVSGLEGKTYNGKAQKQSPVVRLGSATLKAGVDYALSYRNNVGAGTATVVISGKGNYSGSVTKTFKIAKAANPMKVAGKTALAKYGKKKAVVLAASKAYSFKKKAVGKVTYTRVAKGSSKYLALSKRTGKVTVKKGAPKKTHSLKVNVTAAGNANYKSASKTVTVKVRVR